MTLVIGVEDNKMNLWLVNSDVNRFTEEQGFISSMSASFHKGSVKVNKNEHLQQNCMFIKQTYDQINDKNNYSLTFYGD